MGIYGHQFYFKHGLPKVQEIREKFEEITGLYLGYTPYVHLNELMTEPKDILYYLRKSMEESSKPLINSPYFSCEKFNRVYLGDYLDINQKIFDLECGIRTENLYFFKALIKTMHEIGGQTNTNYISPEKNENDEFIQQFLEPYHPQEREWKSIRKWDEMSDFEKAGFKGKYA